MAIFSAPHGLIEEALHARLQEKKITLGTAESCTGGGLAARLVKLAGASSYFQGSIVAYSNTAKIELLHVRRETLEAHGAVSEEVAREMAEGALHQLHTTAAVSVTGIFGPSGGSPQKPVGTVCACIIVPNTAPQTWTMHLTGTREVVMEKTINAVLTKLFKNLTLCI